MNSKIQFELTAGTWVGLLLLSVFSVGLFGASMMAFHPPAKPPIYSAIPPVDSFVIRGETAGGETLRQPIETSPPVNTTARDEVKHGNTIQDCIPCRQPQVSPAITTTWPSIYQPTYQPIYRPSIPVSNQTDTWQDRRQAEQYAAQIGARVVIQNDPKLGVTAFATLSNGQSWATTGGQSTQVYSGLNAFKAVLNDMQQGFVSNYAITPNFSEPPAPQYTGPLPNPKNGRHQLTLFVGNDSKSQSLAYWFQNDPSLTGLRSKCSFEILKANSSMYLTRYASVISAKDFPAVLFSEGDGAHIYAAGGPMLPNDPKTLYSDLKKAYELKQSVKNAPPLINSIAAQSGAGSGLIKQQGGISWDRSITPNLRLVTQDEAFNPDCPDGNCPLPNQPNTWTPGQRIRDGLFPKPEQAAQAVLWASGAEILALVFGVVAIGLLFAIIKKIQG